MEIEDYVEGREIQGQTNKDTFCYWIEWKAEELGMIRNSPAIKFGVYIDKKTQEYFYLKKYLSAQEAFNAKKREILKLLEIAPKKDLKLIKLIDLTPMFKGKILFIYNPDIYLNIFSESYIDYFLQQLGIYNQNKELDILEKREVLIAINEEIGIWNTYEYTDFLYTEFGNPPKRTD